MKCFLQPHVLQLVHAAPGLPCLPANVCEFPLCVEPLELENNPPNPGKPRDESLVLRCSIGLRPSVCQPSEELGQLTGLHKFWGRK